MYKLLIIFFFIFAHLFCASAPQKFEDRYKNAIRELADKYRGKANQKIAILPFKDDPDEQTAIERQIHSLTISEIFNSNKFQLVERELLSGLLKEHSLAQLGMTDSEAIKVGKMAGADLILISSKENKNISFRIVGVDSGSILSFSNLIIDGVDDISVATNDNKPKSRSMTNEYKCKIKIFEGSDKVPEINKRRYDAVFSASSARFIYADASCGILSGKKKEKLQIAFRYVDSDGVLMNQNKHDVEIKPEWGNFTYTSGWGFDEGSSWQRGSYKIEFYIHEQLMDEKIFTLK